MHQYSIIACARWETPYIAEWIAYHHLIGFDHIYLYCNDDDPAAMKAVVDECVKDKPKFVTFRHYPEQGQQIAMYVDALETARSESEWVSFLDIDEFLVLRGIDNVHAFMKRFPADVESVHFNWVLFGNNGFRDRPGGGVLRQYTKRASAVDVHTKHISRSALLSPAKLELGGHPFWHGLADLAWPGINRVNVLGKDMSFLFSNWPENARDYLALPATRDGILATACVNHYQFKSEVDFLQRARRGTSGQFSGQAGWQREYENGNFKQILNALNAVDDLYLHDLSLRLHLPGSDSGIPNAINWQTVAAVHPLWHGNLLLGSNGRLRHAEHGSEADYTLLGDTLTVRWDTWPANTFVRRDGVFVFEPVDAGPPVPASDAVTAKYHIGRGLSGVKSIVDLGACTGSSAAFFRAQYPDAKVIAVEPEPENFRLLSRFAQSSSGIVAIQAAAWHEDTMLSLRTKDASGRAFGPGGARIALPAAEDGTRILALSMQTLMQRHGIDAVDILKVDIEGAELELFGQGNSTWLQTVRYVLIETHEGIRPGSDDTVTWRLGKEFEELSRQDNVRLFRRLQ